MPIDYQSGKIPKSLQYNPTQHIKGNGRRTVSTANSPTKVARDIPWSVGSSAIGGVMSLIRYLLSTHCTRLASSSKRSKLRVSAVRSEEHTSELQSLRHL